MWYPFATDTREQFLLIFWVATDGHFILKEHPALDQENWLLLPGVGSQDAKLWRGRK